VPSDYSDTEFIKLRDLTHKLDVEVAVLKQAKADSDKALVIADEALKHAQAVSNEWRKENIDQRATYPTIAKVDGQITTEQAERRALESRVVLLEKTGNADLGKHSAFDTVWVRFAVILTFVLTVVGLLWSHLGK
jgi:hypothetical protein